MTRLSSMLKGGGSLSTESRNCLVDKGAGAVADGSIDGEDESACRHEGDISHQSVRSPRIFRFHRPVAKTKDESQSEERRESDQAAKFENKKRRDNPEHNDDQSRIEPDPGHGIPPVSASPL